MQVESPVTVAEIAASSLAAVRIFERLGIDYCCGGKRPLAEVCREKGLDASTVQDELDVAGKIPGTGGRDWTTAPLADLVTHIVDTHHAYLRREFGPLGERLAKVYRVYNERYGPTLVGLPEVFAGLRAELEMHMFKEERILFPAIVASEAAAQSGQPLPPTPFGRFANPIGMMEAEHESAGKALREIRAITGDFAIPDYACVTYRALMNGLEELEQDLHVHIHLENNILFPRATELERSGREPSLPLDSSRS
jgi:regulator of cell morphogenesis and NO signaling